MKTWKRWQWATKGFQDFSGILWNSLDASALHAHLESLKLGQRPPHGHESLTPDFVRSRRVCESLNLFGCRWMSRLQEFQYVPILTGYSVPPYVALRSFHLQDWKDWCQERHAYAVCPNVSWRMSDGDRVAGWLGHAMEGSSHDGSTDTWHVVFVSMVGFCLLRIGLWHPFQMTFKWLKKWGWS